MTKILIFNRLSIKGIDIDNLDIFEYKVSIQQITLIIINRKEDIQKV